MKVRKNTTHASIYYNNQIHNAPNSIHNVRIYHLSLTSLSLQHDQVKAKIKIVI